MTNSLSSCPRHPLKKMYSTRKRALCAAGRVNAHKLKVPVKFFAYKCPACKEYHLSKQAPRS